MGGDRPTRTALFFLLSIDLLTYDVCSALSVSSLLPGSMVIRRWYEVCTSFVGGSTVVMLKQTFLGPGT